MAVAKGDLVGHSSTIPEQHMFSSTQYGTSRPIALVSHRHDRVAAFVASLRATAAMLEARIRSEEELGGLGDRDEDHCEMPLPAMRDRLEKLRATIAKVEASYSLASPRDC